VTCLAYHPQQHLAVSTCEDGEFKVGPEPLLPRALRLRLLLLRCWGRRRGGLAAGCCLAPGCSCSQPLPPAVRPHRAQPNPTPRVQVWVRHAAARRPGSQLEQPTAWRCRSVGSYKGFPLHTAAFSPDGSVLAIAAGAAATLWDPASNRLVAALQPPAAAAAAGCSLAALHFVPGTQFLAGLLQAAPGGAGGSGVVVSRAAGTWQPCLPEPPPARFPPHVLSEEP
jgi:hypothetical protein